jgi:hypothetical protein
LLAFVVGVPLALGMASGPPPVPTSWPDWHALARTMGAEQVVQVLVVVVWLVWVQFVACVVVEVLAAVRGGVLARPVPLAGPSQRLARALVAAVLLTAAMATQASAAVAAPQLSVTAAGQITPDPGSTAAAPTVSAREGGSGAGSTAGHAQASRDQGRQDQASAGSGHDRVLRGQVVPRDAGEDLVGCKVYVVQPPQGRHHESLWEIAERHLGDGRRYQEIYALNHGRAQPDGRSLHLARLIQPGWLLVMPEDAVGVERYLPPPDPDSAVQGPAGADAGAGDQAAAGAGDQAAAGAGDQATAATGTAQASGGLQGGSGRPGAAVLPGSKAPSPEPFPAPPPRRPVSGLGAAPSPAVVAELGGSGLLGAGLLAVLLVGRRRHRGPDPSASAVETEVWLRVGADPGRADRLDRALRGLPAGCRQAGVGLPNVYAAVLDDVSLELLLAPPAPQPPAGWTAVADGARWRLERSTPVPDSSDRSPYPALVSLGRDAADRDILLQLGAQAGPVAVTGNPAAVLAVISSLAVELATNRWSDPLRVTVTDLPTVTSALAGGRLVAGTVTDVLDRIEAGLPGLPGDSMVTGRRAVPEGTPQHLVLGRSPDSQTRLRLRELAVRGVGLLVAGEVEGFGWRLQVDDAGTLTVPELGIVVTASRLGEESMRRLHDLFATAAAPDGPALRSPASDPSALDPQAAPSPALHPLAPHPLAHTAPNRGPASGLGADGRLTLAGRPEVLVSGTSADDAAWAVAPARVGVLGPVLIRAAGGVDPARAEQIAELVAFLALHPGGVHPTVLAGAIWPRGVTADVRDATIARARDWLGTDELGGNRLRTDAEGRLALSPDVAVDWDVVCTLLGRSRLATDPRVEVDLLARALRLVRGPLAGGVEAGRYAWLARTGLPRSVPVLVADAAHRLSELLSDTDPHAATDAAHRGLLVDPCDQQLWRDVIRCQFAQWGADGARSTAEEMIAVMARLGVEPDGPTQALLADLMPGAAVVG